MAVLWPCGPPAFDASAITLPIISPAASTASWTRLTSFSGFLAAMKQLVERGEPRAGDDALDGDAVLLLKLRLQERYASSSVSSSLRGANSAWPPSDGYVS